MFTFEAPIPAGTAAVELVSGGQVVDHKARTQPPTVRVLAPRAGARVGGGARSGLTVRWTAADPDRDKLEATVEYAANGVSRWRTVFNGPSTGRTTIPGRYLERSAGARVRVKISDGFNQTTARSARFRADGTPPVARIVRPGQGESLQAGTRGVVLQGTGMDDAQRILRGRALTWFAGRRRLGSGPRVQVKLPAGNVTLRLRVRDAAGRVTTATRRLRIAPVALRLTKLVVPDRVKPGARSVKATVAVTTAATLRAGGRSFRVGPRARKIAIPLPARPRLGPLAVKYKVTARGVRQRALSERIVVVRA
jgi:hypothetical protein